MNRKDIKIKSSEGKDVDFYLVTPDAKGKVPAIVMASAVHGVDAVHREICDEFAKAGYIAAGPDLFWRVLPGPLQVGDKRMQERSQPREEKIKTGEADLADTAKFLRTLPECNGKVAVIGLCYGGPYAVLGPKRLGYDAGIGCHSSLMMPYLKELEGVTQPVCLLWGDQDHSAPPEVQAAYLDKAKQMKNLEVHIFPGIKHGYMMHSAEAYDKKTYDFSMKRTLEILGGLRGEGPAMRKAS